MCIYIYIYPQIQYSALISEKSSYGHAPTAMGSFYAFGRNVLRPYVLLLIKSKCLGAKPIFEFIQ